MQAIVTKYLGPTDRRGSRVVAECGAGRITLGWLSALNPEDNHARAAVQLCRKLGWVTVNYGVALMRGGLPQSSKHAYCFVFVNSVGEDRVEFTDPRFVL